LSTGKASRDETGAFFSEARITTILKEAEGSVKVADLCRRQGISGATFYTWHRKHGGLEVSQMRWLRQLEEENRLLKSSWPTRRWIFGHSRTYAAKNDYGPR
jgi:putative transposase